MLICKIKANACGQRIQNKGLLALFHGHDPYFDDRDNNKIIRAIHITAPGIMDYARK